MNEHPEGFRFASDFGPPPAAPLPQPGELFVLVCEVEVPAARLAMLRATFSPREEQRFQSFATDVLRGRWGASRGFLREALGAALGLPGAEVAFSFGPHGKPVLHGAQQPAGGKLHF